MPIFVERDDDKFILNTISMSKVSNIIPFFEEDEDYLSPLNFDDNDTLEDDSSGILLYKDSEYISIQRLKFVPNSRIEKYYEKFEYLSKIYYIKKSKYIGSAIVFYPKHELYITMPSLDKDLLNEICSF